MNLFKAVGWVPTARPGVVFGDTLQGNYTTVLDIVALYWLYRNGKRFGGGAGYAKGLSAACRSR